MTSIAGPICLGCVHYRDDRKCAAYPDGIPRKIWRNEVDHRKPYRGDHETQFRMKPGMPPFPEHLFDDQA